MVDAPFDDSAPNPPYVPSERVTRGFAAMGLDIGVRHVQWPNQSAAAGVSHGETSVRRALVVECDGAWDTLSWATVGGGLRCERRYVCAEVRNSDLPLGVQPRDVVSRFLQELGSDSGVVALTSANIAEYRAAFTSDGELAAAVVVTAGLANALRVGEPSVGPPRRYLPDTINLACWVNAPLTTEARLEALSIVAQARTLEVLEAKVPSLEQNGWATGTGTDCITLFSRRDADTSASAMCYAGMHTAVGRVLGRATREAVADVVRAWQVAKARSQATLSR